MNARTTYLMGDLQFRASIFTTAKDTTNKCGPNSNEPTK